MGPSGTLLYGKFLEGSVVGPSGTLLYGKFLEAIILMEREV